MSDVSDSLLGIIPVVVVGGVALAFADKFLGKQGRKKKPFDKLEERDRRGRGKLGFGDFSNIGY